jgi:hypothetical protein
MGNDIALGKAKVERDTAAQLVDQFINHADQLTDAAGNRLGTPQFLEIVDLNAEGHDDVRISYSNGYQVILTNQILAADAASAAARLGETADSKFLNRKVEALYAEERQYVKPEAGHVSTLNFDSASSQTTEIVVGRAKKGGEILALLQGPGGGTYYQDRATPVDERGLDDAAVAEIGQILGDPMRDETGRSTRPFPVDVYADGGYVPGKSRSISEIELEGSRNLPFEDINNDGRIEQTVLMPDGHKRFVLQYDKAVLIAAQRVARAQQDLSNAQAAYDQNPRAPEARQALEASKLLLQTETEKLANVRQLGLWALAAAQRKPTEPADLNGNGWTEKVVAVDMATNSAKRVNVQDFVARPMVERSQDTLDLLLENLTQIVIDEDGPERP